MLVYRYEHPKTGKGPYRTCDTRVLARLGNKLRDAHGGWGSRRPTPVSDGLGFFRSDSQICGMVSERKLRWWFWGFIRLLREAGYVQKVYNVPEGYAQVSPRTGQVVFDRSKAVVVC